LNERELVQIEKLTTEIAKNLFGEGYKGNRVQDTQVIGTVLREEFKIQKKENKNIDISGVLEKNMDKLVGEAITNKGYLYNTVTKTGLTKLYKDNTSYTTTGLITGGIKLNEKKILSEEFKSSLKNHIEKEVKGELKELVDTKQKESKLEKKSGIKDLKKLASLIDPKFKEYVVDNKQQNPTLNTSIDNGKNKGIGGR